MNGEVVVVDDVASAFADLVVATNARDQAPRTIVLSGGGTARRCYEVLATRSGVDWPTMTVLFGDERWVPLDHADSNEGMARDELLDHVAVGSVRSLHGGGPTIEAAAEAYDVLLRSLPPADLVHLGLGPDGHTASLFPGSDALATVDRLVVSSAAGLEPWHERLTWTLPAIATARHVVVTVEGEAKREVWERLLAGDTELPAARITAARITWLVDRGLVQPA